MRLTYTPADGQAHQWDYHTGKIMSAEAEAIERVTGMTYRQEFPEKLLTGSTLALRALLWVFLKRTAPTTKFSDVSFMTDEVDLDFDDNEKRQMREEVLADTSLSDDDRQEMLAALAGDEVGDDPAGADPKG